LLVVLIVDMSFFRDIRDLTLHKLIVRLC